MNGIFIAGTDTGVGKSIVTGLLARFFLAEGKKVATQKWVQTGVSKHSDDLAIHEKLSGKFARTIEMSPYAFKHASSPHLASHLEKKVISADRIKKSFRKLSREHDIVIVEGTGGILVPLSKDLLIIDIVRELSIPCVVVAPNKLGTINHTLLTVEALKRRGINILGIIFNEVKKHEDKAILKDNPLIVRAITNETILGVLPMKSKNGDLYTAFKPMAKKIYKMMDV